MRNWKKYLLYAIGLFLIVAQFIRPDRSIEEIPADQDFLAIMNPPPQIGEMIKTACYDCHANTTKYPWYAEVAPVSWWIQDHVNHGKEHLNFANWGSYPADKAAHKLEECFEEVEEGEMPLKSYTWLHSEAKLSEDQRSALVGWFKQQYAKVH